MLTSDKYQEGLNALEKSKYNINYCKIPIFDIVCSGLANALLNHEFSEELTEEQKQVLNNLID